MTRWTAGERMTAYGSSADMALSWGRFGAQAAVVQICGTKPRDGSERKRFRSGTSGRDNNARNCCDVTHRRVLAPDETRPTSTPIRPLPSGYDWGRGGRLLAAALQPVQTNWRLELVDILGAVAAETPNLKLMIRPCAPPRKCRRCLEIVREHPTAPSLPVWVMAEVPSVAYWIPPTRRLVSRVSIRNI